jgi:hypothetical protein
MILFARNKRTTVKVAAQAVQYTTLSTTNLAFGMNYAVQTNQLISLIGYDWKEGPTVKGNLADGTPLFIAGVNQSGVAGVVWGPQIPQILTGLTNISIVAVTTQNAVWATFQITTPASASIATNYVPADAVVIPSSATGNVQIILESSSDLVNWTAADPGIYGASSATNRFFRVRAVGN